jgi:hypothetical protein
MVFSRSELPPPARPTGNKMLSYFVKGLEYGYREKT